MRWLTDESLKIGDKICQSESSGLLEIERVKVMEMMHLSRYSYKQRAWERGKMIHKHLTPPLKDQSDSQSAFEWEKSV